MVALMNQMQKFSAVYIMETARAYRMVSLFDLQPINIHSVMNFFLAYVGFLVQAATTPIHTS
jgi:hypothetical protein